MKIALIGATGFVGSAILKEALDRGHDVTAIVRHPEKLQPHATLHPQKGDVYNADEVARLVAGHDAVISAFNPGWKNQNLYEDQVRGTTAIIGAVKKAGVKRVLWVGVRAVWRSSRESSRWTRRSFPKTGNRVHSQPARR